MQTGNFQGEPLQAYGEWSLIVFLIRTLSWFSSVFSKLLSLCFVLSTYFAKDLKGTSSLAFMY